MPFSESVTMMQARYRNLMHVMALVAMFAQITCTTATPSRLDCIACVGKCIEGVCYERLARGPASWSSTHLESSTPFPVRRFVAALPAILPIESSTPFGGQPVAVAAPQANMNAFRASGAMSLPIEYIQASDAPHAEFTDISRRSAPFPADRAALGASGESVRLLPAASAQGAPHAALRLLQTAAVLAAPLRDSPDDLARPARLANADEAHLRKKVELLQAQIDAVRAAEAATDAQNQGLRKELQNWRAAGSRIAEREGRIVDIVRRLHDEEHPLEGYARSIKGSVVDLFHKLRGEEQTLESFASVGIEGLAHKLRERLSSENSGGVGRVFLGGAASSSETSSTKGLPSYVLQVAVIAILGVVLVLGGRMRERLPSLPAGQVMTCGAWGCCLKPILRRVGASRYLIAISEVQVCLPSESPGGSFSVAFQSPSGLLRTTSAEHVADSSVHRFRDVLCLELGRADGPCDILVLDRDQSADHALAKIAWHRVDAKDILKAAHKDGAGYVRYALSSARAKQTEGKSACSDGTIDEEDDLPFVAMRIRDVTNSRSRPEHEGLRAGGLHAHSQEASPCTFGTFSR